MGKIIWITGKGGVGKSTYALALAKKLSKSSKVSLFELADTSSYNSLFGGSQKFKEFKLQNKKNLHISCLNAESSLKEYVSHLLKIKKIADLFFSNKVMRAILNGAPALKELSVLGKATSSVRNIGPEFSADYVIVDAYSSGHFLSLIDAPEGLANLIPSGPMGKQSRDIMTVLKDDNLCSYRVVCLPEVWPAQEARELSKKIYDKLGIQPQFIINQVTPEMLSPSESSTVNFVSDDLTHLYTRFIDYTNKSHRDQKPFIDSFPENSVNLPLSLEPNPSLKISELSNLEIS